jgi:hypothetical protein
MSATEQAGASEAVEAVVAGQRPDLGADSADTASADTGSPDTASTAAPPAASDPEGTSRRRWRSLAARVRPLGPAVALYTAVKGLGFASFLLLLHYAHDQKYISRSMLTPISSVFAVLGSWDGAWYRGIAEHGYHPALIPTGAPLGTEHSMEQNAAAFFPLYPTLIRIVHECTRLGYLKSAVLASILASLVAAAGIYAVGKLLAGHKAALIAVALWAVFPSSGVEWSAYSESSLVAVAAWCLYFALRKQWLTAGVLAMVAGLSRPTAIAVVGAYAVAALIALYRRRDGWIRPLAGLCIAPLGSLGYLLWVSVRMGSLTAYPTLERDAWGQYFDFGRWTAMGYLRTVMGQRFWHDSPQEDLIAVALLTILPMLLLLLLRTRPPAAIVVYVVLFTGAALTTRQNFGNISRYLLPVFPLLYPLGLGLRRLSWPVLGTCLGIAALASGWYAGYVPFVLGVP